MFMNEICEGVHSRVKLFADYSVVYRIVEHDVDACALQDDLKVLQGWWDRWEMRLNIKKKKV